MILTTTLRDQITKLMKKKMSQKKIHIKMKRISFDKLERPGKRVAKACQFQALKLVMFTGLMLTLECTG